MRLTPRTAAYRIGILSAAIFAFATAMIGVAVFYAVHAAFVSQLGDSVVQAQVSLMGEYHDDGHDGLAEAIAIRETSASSILGFAVFDSQGQRTAGRLDTQLPSLGWSRILFLDPIEGADPALALTSRLPDGSSLVVSADLEPVERMDDTILAVFGVAFFAILGMGGIFAFGLGRYLKRRLDAIALGSRAFASGSLAERAKVGERDDEFDQLAASLNAMLDHIEGLVSNLRQVTSDLAHDMRTPLTRLRNDLEGLLEAPAGHCADRVDRAVARCEDILRLFASILRISELEGGDVRQYFRPIDLSELTQDIVEAHELLAEENGQLIVFSGAFAHARVEGDRDLLAQAMVNLIENALRHSPQGGRVTVGVIDHYGRPALQVCDEGPGVAEADRGRVIKRFVRLEEARNSPGFGLGLALVKAIAEAHGGELVLGDANPGLDARIILPPSVSS